MAPSRFRRREYGSVNSVDKRALEAERCAIEVNVAPAEREQLTSTGASYCTKQEECTERGTCVHRRGDERSYIVRARRANLWRRVARRACVRCGVGPHPLPSDSLLECPVQDDVDAMHGPCSERSSLTSAGSPQMRVEVVNVRGGELGHCKMAEVGLQVVLEEALRFSEGAR